MDLFYINYPELNEDGNKRIIFLERIFRILKLKESIKYNQLDLSNSDLKLFFDLINSSFDQYISIFNDEINMKVDMGGPVIIGINVLIDDLAQILAKNEGKIGIVEIIGKLKDNDIGQQDLNTYFKELAPLLFQKWLFKYITISLIPHSTEGLKIYVECLKELDFDEIKKIFDLNLIIKEIRLLPKRKDRGEINVSDIDNIKQFLLNIIYHIEYLYPSMQNWFHFKMQIVELFKGDEYKEKKSYIKNTVKNSEQKFKQREGDIWGSEQKLKENISLFLVKRGNRWDLRNKIISYYEGKVALFKNSTILNNRLKVNDIVLCEIIVDKRTYMIIDPIKRITDKKEALNYFEKGVKCGSSKKEIMLHLRGKNGR